MVSTARDLVVWGDALYGGAVLEPGSLAEMVAFGDEGYGLGARSYTLAGRPVWGHSGSLRGFVAQLSHLPEEDITISVVINRGRVDPDVVATPLGKVILGHLFPSRPTFAAQAL
jgi:D-alanyl-D-alanine carboxypeptidase